MSFKVDRPDRPDRPVRHVRPVLPRILFDPKCFSLSSPLAIQRSLFPSLSSPPLPPLLFPRVPSAPRVPSTPSPVQSSPVTPIPPLNTRCIRFHLDTLRQRPPAQPQTIPNPPTSKPAPFPKTNLSPRPVHPSRSYTRLSVLTVYFFPSWQVLSCLGMPLNEPIPFFSTSFFPALGSPREPPNKLHNAYCSASAARLCVPVCLCACAPMCE